MVIKQSEELMMIFPRLSSRRTAVTRIALLGLLATVSSVTNGSAQTENRVAKPDATIVTLTGLRITDTTVGTGPSPEVGQTCVINYTTWLYVNGAKGNKVESSSDNGKPLTFVFGKGQVRREWDEGIATMKVGGKRTIIAPTQIRVSPPEVAEGAPANGKAIDHALNRFEPSGYLFEIELLDVR
jgi:peptidylprolyl isomerase